MLACKDYVEKTPDVTAVGSLVEVKDPRALRARLAFFVFIISVCSFCEKQVSHMNCSGGFEPSSPAPCWQINNFNDFLTTLVSSI